MGGVGCAGIATACPSPRNRKLQKGEQEGAITLAGMLTLRMTSIAIIISKGYSEFD